MSRKNDETRAIRSGLDTYLSNKNWSDITFTEGWSELDIEKPLVNIYIIDHGKENLELGRQVNTHSLYRRTVQIDSYMETEDRVNELCDDVMDFLDQAALTITDLLTTSGVGYISFPDSSTIQSTTIPPQFNNPEILRWRGVVKGSFESYYPAG